MRISDCSSDVCSSDLLHLVELVRLRDRARTERSGTKEAEQRDDDAVEVGRGIDIVVIACTHVEETRHIGAAARNLLVELADEAGEALAYRVRQAGVVDNGREFGARGSEIAGNRAGKSHA